jgi:hypothetical protein
MAGTRYEGDAMKRRPRRRGTLSVRERDRPPADVEPEFESAPRRRRGAAVVRIEVEIPCRVDRSILDLADALNRWGTR